jgi:hypothetical protein
MELKNARIKSIGKLKTFDKSDFSCVEWVVTTDEEYPQTLALQSNKDKAENLIKFNKVGDVVDVSVNLRGREWTNPEGVVKVFNTIEAWKVFKAETLESAAALIDSAFEPGNDLNGAGDDLPF